MRVFLTDADPDGWARSAKGNLWVKTDRATVTIFRSTTRSGRYRFCIARSARSISYSPDDFPDEQAAIRAAWREIERQGP
jgi:hypothetical protein